MFVIAPAMLDPSMNRTVAPLTAVPLPMRTLTLRLPATLPLRRDVADVAMRIAVAALAQT